MLFAGESGMKIDFEVVDLFTGEHVKPPYAGMYPNKLVPRASAAPHGTASA